MQLRNGLRFYRTLIMLFFFFFWFDSLFRLTNSKLVILLALLLSASISHELRWHTVPDGSDVPHTSLKNHDNHLHHVHELSVNNADESHQTNHTCDFFHSDLSEILHLSDTSISLIEKKARVAPEGNFSKFIHSYTYRARAPPAA